MKGFAFELRRETAATDFNRDKISQFKRVNDLCAFNAPRVACTNKPTT